MSIEHLLAFNLALLAALVSPGPALLYAVRATLGGGRAAGLATGCGLATMAAAWTLMALLGLEGLFRLFPWAYTSFKVIGALYLLYLAWSAWRGARHPIGQAARPKTRAFVGGLLVNLANPKSVLFSAAVLVVIFPAGLTVTDKAIIVANHLAVEVMAYGAFALLLSTQAVGQRYLRLKPMFDRLSALILGGLGLRLMVER
ncbi:MAG: LysE family transporter [Pseudomonadota bacterium]